MTSSTSSSTFHPPSYSEEWLSIHANEGKPLADSHLDRNHFFEVDGINYVLHEAKPYERYMLEQLSERNLGPKIYASFPNINRVLMERIQEPTITPQIAKQHPHKIGENLKKFHEIPLYEERGKSFRSFNSTRWEEIKSWYDAQKRLGKPIHPKLEALVKDGGKAMEIFEKEMGKLQKMPSSRLANIHTDLHARNCFWRNNGIILIDLEDTSHGESLFDVASVAIFQGFDQREELELLKGYFGREPTEAELREYFQLKKIRWAYTCIGNIVWIARIWKNNIEERKPELDKIEQPTQSFGAYMQAFATEGWSPSLEFFVNVARLALKEAKA